MTHSHITEALNQQQHLAVTAPPSNMLVLAGAGSGKTRVLVHRIAWLMQVEHISPHAIFAVTFTNKAAAEMRGRIESLLQFSLSGMWVGTFHGLAHRLLRIHWADAGLVQNFQILDSDDQYRLIRRLLKALQLDESQWQPRRIQGYINQQKDAGKRPHQVAEPRDPYHQTLLRVYQAYEEACQRGCLIDFAELLLRSHELLAKNPDLLQHYQQRFQHILVDEFQDTNSIQYNWIKLLAGKSSYVMCVGDDDQSIYGWRGARVENIQRFLDDFPKNTLIRLEQNYRSTLTILTAANALIANNHDRLGKNLWTESSEGAPISVYAAFNEIDESRFIVTRIEDWIAQGNRYNSIAILYRSNAQSRSLEESLIRQAIPYRVYGGLRYFERAEIKDALAYLRLLANRNDDAAIERVINTPTRGIGDKTVSLLRDYSRQEQCSLWQAALATIAAHNLTARATNALQGFIHLIDELADNTSLFELHAQAETVLHGSGLMDHYAKDKSEKGMARIENLKELVSATKQFTIEHDSDIPILSEFLSHAALEAGDTQEDKTSQDCVQLMTLHTAKGLEFPLVFISGLEEGLFPHRMSAEEEGRLAEERRLCYVGMTRAMQKLYLSYAEIRRLHGKEQYNRPSRFIRELPEDSLENIRLTHHVSRPTTTIKPSKMQGEVSGTGFRLGQMVHHKKYGDGVIINYQGSGPSAQVQVEFTQFGAKTLVVGYAKLQPLDGIR